MKFFVGGVAKDGRTTEDSFRKFFSQFGVITDVMLQADRGFGFVEIEQEGDNLAALLTNERHILDGSSVEVKIAKPKGTIAPTHDTNPGRGRAWQGHHITKRTAVFKFATNPSTVFSYDPIQSEAYCTLPPWYSRYPIESSFIGSPTIQLIQPYTPPRAAPAAIPITSPRAAPGSPPSIFTVTEQSPRSPATAATVANPYYQVAHLQKTIQESKPLYYRYQAAAASTTAARATKISPTSYSGIYAYKPASTPAVQTYAHAYHPYLCAQ